MHTKQAIQFALTVSNGAVLSVIDRMSDAPTTFPTPNGGCHPLWVLGHLTFVEGMVPGVLYGEKIALLNGKNTSAKTRNQLRMSVHTHRSPRFARSIWNCASEICSSWSRSPRKT